LRILSKDPGRFDSESGLPIKPIGGYISLRRLTAHKRTVIPLLEAGTVEKEFLGEIKVKEVSG